MLSRISSTQLTEWIAYSAIEPWDEERADLRTGILAALTANINRSKDQKAYKPTDFMPKFGEKKDNSQSWQTQLQMVQMLNRAYGGKDLRKQ